MPNAAPIGQAKQRDCLFDNIRFLLILLVAFAHLLSPISKQNAITKDIYYFIYLFHMPAFVFISGYFSKNAEKCRETAVPKLLLPFFVLNLISSILYLHSGGKAWYQLNILHPRWGMWFLLSMFLWRFFLKDITKLRCALPACFVIGLLSGCFPAFDSFLALGRTLAFLPLFMAGYYTTPALIEKLRRIPKWVGGLTALLCAAFAVTASRYKLFPHQAMFLRDDYHTLDQGFLEGILWRCALYLFGLLMTFALINLFSRRHSYLSEVGRNTLSIYALHLFIVPRIKDLKLFGGKGYLYLFAAFAIAAVLVFLLSSKPVVFLYNKGMDGIAELIFPTGKGFSSRGVLWTILILSLLGGGGCVYLYLKNGRELYFSGAITCFTILYHIAFRLAAGGLLRRFAKPNPKSRFFTQKPWEPKLYRFLRVKRWKGKLPTYYPEDFDPRTHAPEQLLTTMCVSELGHEINAVLSFLPLFAALFVGALPVFLITGIVAALFDLSFAVIQRYNRPRVEKLLHKREK